MAKNTGHGSRAARRHLQRVARGQAFWVQPQTSGKFLEARARGESFGSGPTTAENWWGRAWRRVRERIG